MDYTGWLDRYRRAWLTKNAEAATLLFSAEAAYHSSPTAPPHVGHSAIAAYWHQATRTQRDLKLEFGTPIVEGNRVAVEWWATMRDPDWSPDAANDLVTLPGCLILIFNDTGLCVELREYYNPRFGEALAPHSGWGR